MEFGVILLTLGAYGLAIYLCWRERSANYLVALIAGNLLALLSPIWQSLYGFSYTNGLPTMYMLLGRPLPRTIFLAAWTIMPAAAGDLLSLSPPLVGLGLRDWPADVCAVCDLLPGGRDDRGARGLVVL